MALNKRGGSRYEPVWQKLRDNGEVQLAIIPKLAGRIVKAVKKRKNLDTSYRFQLAELGIQTYLSASLSGNILTIKLVRKIFLRDRI